MQIYNSMTRKKEPFVPLHEGKVGIYACGPTVYNFFHIGNARPFIVFDVLRRYLEYRGYEVTFVQNFTDIDDKMIRRANEEHTTVDAIAEKYIGEYFKDAEALGVMKADVLAAAGVGAAAAPAAEAAAAVESNDEKPVKVNPLRRSIAANMTNSWHTSPRVTYTRPVEVTAMKDLRAKLKDGLKEQGIKLTYNHILMKVVAKALTEFPDVNASFADNMLTRHKHVNMGLAVAKGDGLIVPNVKNCEEKSLAQIAQETEALIEATRTGKLGMEDMTGGTFTISSLGPYGITSFSPIINQPELAILGVCDMVDTPVVRNGEIVIRTMMNLSLTADHRVIDGVMASKFLKRIAELLENPYMLLV